MKISKDNLFRLIIFCSAINGTRVILPLGEIQYEAYVLPLFMFIGLSLITDDGKMKQNVFVFCCCIIAIVASSFFLNFNEIIENHFKGKSGLGKFLNQSILTVIMVMYSIYLSKNYYGRAEELAEDLKRYSIYGFYLVLAYCFFEYLAFYVEPIDSLVNALDLIIRDPSFADFHLRLRGLQYETPAFGGYLGFMCIVFLDRIFFDRKRRFYVHYILVLVLGILSGSRTAIVVSLIISLFYLAVLVKSKVVKKRFALATIFGAIMLLAINETVQTKILSVVSGIGEKSDHSHSNLTRFGGQVAAIKMALNHPLTGIGYGQYGFNVSDYYPEWAKYSYQVGLYMSPHNSGWPNAYSLIARIFAEFGMVVFILLVIVGFRVFLNLYRRVGQVEHKIQLYSFAAIMFVHSILIFLQFDSIRNIYFWSFLSLYFLMSSNGKKKWLLDNNNINNESDKT